MMTGRQVKLLEAEMLRHRAMASIADSGAAVHAELAEALGAALVIVRRELILNQKRRDMPCQRLQSGEVTGSGRPHLSKKRTQTRKVGF